MPAAVLAQTSARAATVWVPQGQLGVGREIAVEFADVAGRLAHLRILRDEATLPTVAGKAWSVAGPLDVVEAFEMSLRRQVSASSATRALSTRSLIVRCACEP